MGLSCDSLRLGGLSVAVDRVRQLTESVKRARIKSIPIAASGVRCLRCNEHGQSSNSPDLKTFTHGALKSAITRLKA